MRQRNKFKQLITRGESWSDGEFLEHISCLYFDDYYRAIEGELKGSRKKGLDKEAEEFRDRFFARM